MNEHPIQGMMSTAMQKIKEMVDVNTIIGDPISTLDGPTIIPVSKVSFGFGSGGSDINSKSEKDLFGGGCAAGISIQPLAFLIISPSNDVKLLQISQSSNTADKVVNMVPELIDKISDLFKKDSSKDDEKSDNADQNVSEIKSL